MQQMDVLLQNDAFYKLTGLNFSNSNAEINAELVDYKHFLVRDKENDASELNIAS